MGTGSFCMRKHVIHVLIIMAAASFLGADSRINRDKSVSDGRILFGRKRTYHLRRIGFWRPHHFRHTLFPSDK